MRKIGALVVAGAAAITFVVTQQPAEAAVKWDGSVVEIVNKLPGSWKSAVKSGTNWLDQYTGSDLRIVKKCNKSARRCVVIKPGKVRTSNKARGLSKGSTITIDVQAAKHFTYKQKKYLIAHELGHQRFQQHSKSCNNFMNSLLKCNGH